MLHLCTEEKTLECKYVETTNSLYLVESSDNSQVRSCSDSSLCDMPKGAAGLSWPHTQLIVCP